MSSQFPPGLYRFEARKLKTFLWFEAGSVSRETAGEVYISCS